MFRSFDDFDILIEGMAKTEYELITCQFTTAFWDTLVSGY